MKKLILTLGLFLLIQPAFGWSIKNPWQAAPEKQVKKVIFEQVKYANKCNFEKFISTYDPNYRSADGFDLDIYSNLVKDIWDSYENVRYNVKIKKIEIKDDNAVVELDEYSNANIPVTKDCLGELKSVADSIYYLRKVNGKWKVTSELVLDETTSMLYGDARDLDIKLDVPKQIEENTEYTASLEFVPPAETVAIASISSEKVEYPQKQAKEVFRTMPEDNILERLFTSNNDKVNEYIIASIGLTKTDVTDLSIKLSLTGFGYVIKRVNVIPAKIEECVNEQNK